jgi:uncharacterized protein (DUF2147 family)
MKFVVVIATLLMTGTQANAADSYSFNIGGRLVLIHAPSHCASPSCLSVSIPGVFEYGPRRGYRVRNDTRLEEEVSVSAETDNAPPAALPPSPQTSKAPRSPTSAKVTGPEPSAQQPATPAPQPRPAPATVVATAPTAAPIQPLQAPTPTAPQAANSPLGVWLTEEKEGKVRIEQCGANLCDYSIDARTNQNKEKVLLNMRPNGTKWSGRIHDPKGGSSYDSTIAMKSPDRLQVQGCAFGGMFCGGQTWSRVN